MNERMTYRCIGALVHRKKDAFLTFSHACDVTTGDVSLMGQTARLPWSSIPRWIASIHDSLSGVGFMSGMIPFVSYLSKDGEDVRVTFCQPDTIWRTLMESVDGPAQEVADKIGRTVSPRAINNFRWVDELRAVQWPSFVARQAGRNMSLRDFEASIRMDLESRSKHVFEGKPDVILKSEIFSRKTA
jgi:hypothetical protein